MSLIDPVLDSIDALMAWFSSSVKQTSESYCDLETAEDEHTLVARDGSLVSIIKVKGIAKLIGTEEFDRLCLGVGQGIQSTMSNPGRTIQVFFSYDREYVEEEITAKLTPAMETAKRLNLDLKDLFEERIGHVSKFCAKEEVYFVLWTRPTVMTKDQLKLALKDKNELIKKHKLPPLRNAQNVIASMEDIRNAHHSFVRSLMNDMSSQDMYVNLMTAHDALHDVRMSVDPDFTAPDWRPVLPGDTIPIRDLDVTEKDIGGVMWPPLSRQVIPRDAEVLDLRTIRLGDKLYSSVFIDLFPQQIQPFVNLFKRTLPTEVPWRIAYHVTSSGMEFMRFKTMLAGILSWTSDHNKLIADSGKILKHIDMNTDDAVVKLQVTLSTWAPADDERLLRVRASELAKAVEGWGTCEVSEVSGDPFASVVSSMLGVSVSSVATPSAAPLTDVITMLPITRPASSWEYGAMMLRSPDGKPWAYQPGSSMQTTWIDLLYARPGSGKSVLSNAINLALCLSAGIQRLPRISIIDVGPSSSGLISLIREALSEDKRHLVAYHRLRMTPEYSINPFDTQLGCRFPTPGERSFLVNFLTLLATPIGSERPYDGVPDMVGLIVDELYKELNDSGKPHQYTLEIEPVIDNLLNEIGFVRDAHTSWWEVTDALFGAGLEHEAMLAQRHAMPLLSDVTSICRTPAVEDLYGNVTAPTGEALVLAFTRMISSAVREYPILSRVTQFDIGDARVVSLDLDEVAKSGGEASDRQTAVMYMLARYVLAKHYYLVEDNLAEMPEKYHRYHKERILEIREDPKRIVYDEFHRTSKTQAVRDQVIVDMREGRKWNVQIALISQSVEDFDEVMIEFATSIFVMDAGPNQAIRRTKEIFGLSETAEVALRTRVHGPKAHGATFLAQFSTKDGINTQLLTSTVGPIELWAFSTTSEDAMVRNKLYQKFGPKEARRVLANLFPSGSVKGLVEKRLAMVKEEAGMIEEADATSVVDQLIASILEAYAINVDVKSLPEW